MSPSPRKESPPVDDSSGNSPDDSSPDDSPSPPTNSKSSPSPPDTSSKSPPSSSPPKSPPPSDKSSPPPSPDKSSPPPSPDKSSPPPNSDKSSPPPPDKSSPPPYSDKNSPPSGDDHSSPPNNKSPSHDSDNNNNNNSNNSRNNNNNNNSGNNNNNNNSGDNNNNNNNGNNNSKNDQNSNSNNNNNNNNNNSNNKYQPPPKSGSSSLSPPYQPPSSQARSASLPAIIDNSDPPPSGPSRTVIVGAAAGAGFLVVVMIVCIVACARRKKRRPHDQMHYYRDNSHGGGYFNTVPQKNKNTSAGPEHIVQLPPRTSSAQVSSEYNWPIAPPPPPPMMNSSAMSSAGFSGPYQAAPPPPPAMALGFNQSSFTYNDLAAATNNFAQANLLGQGGFGYVHKGVLPNGKEIAVKSLKASSGQGEREFQAEVDIISRVHHRHLVSLVGYCIAGSQRMLVYEFVPNGTLEYHLHGDNRPTMNWATRLKIALGAAKGFAYLHEDCHPRIIHRDIKTANILLEHNFEAKVADFGLAKLSSENHTHVSTRIMGTFGYLAPEYASSGKLTEKSDVYSYGIMLLELITGRRPIDIESDDDSLVDWARPILVRVTEGESYEELVDPRLENNYDPQEMLRMVASAGACVRQSAKKRPKMSQIVRCLEGDVSLDVLNEGVRSVHTAMFGSGSSEDDGSSVDMKRFRKGGATSSQEYSSSELGTGEFVHNNNKH